MNETFGISVPVGLSVALASIIEALGSALLHFVWQGAVLGLLAAVLLALLRNARPQARYAVACAALAACVIVPSWNLLHALIEAAPSASASQHTADSLVLASAVATERLPLAIPSAWHAGLPWVVALWATGVTTLSLRMGCGLLWVRRLYRQADGELAGHWQSRVDALAARMGIARPVALRIIRTGHTPVTAGWWRPAILLPLAIATRMPADLLEALLAHEVAHVRRHDYLVNLLQSVAEALLFYHPVVWWLSARIRRERELVADDLAATALGDRRRLALALAELDRHAPPASSTALPQLAPAAHGGHLMSRIQQLIRPQDRAPQRRVLAGALAIPLVGLAVAGAAFYAHARLDAPVAPPAPAVRTPSLPAPLAAPGLGLVASAAEARDREPSTFALVESGGDSIRMTGEISVVDEIKSVRDRVGGDFVWFRRDGRSWVVRDAQTIAGVREAWAPTDALNRQLEALEAKMQPHTDRIEALSARMEAISEQHESASPEMEAAAAQMEALGERMEAVVERQEDLADEMDSADKADLATFESRQEALRREQAVIQEEMDKQERRLGAINTRIEARQAPIEALSKEVEAAHAPMEAISRDMEALGKRIEAESTRADSRIRELLDEAYRNGRAEPAPVKR